MPLSKAWGASGPMPSSSRDHAFLERPGCPTCPIGQLPQATRALLALLLHFQLSARILPRSSTQNGVLSNRTKYQGLQFQGSGIVMRAHRGKFIAYYRVSTDKQGKSGLGLEAQRQAVIATLDSGVEFIAVDNPHANKLTIHILAAVAQHEREMIAQRTARALTARGVKTARGGEWSAVQIADILRRQ